MLGAVPVTAAVPKTTIQLSPREVDELWLEADQRFLSKPVWDSIQEAPGVELQRHLEKVVPEELRPTISYGKVIPAVDFVMMLIRVPVSHRLTILTLSGMVFEMFLRADVREDKPKKPEIFFGSTWSMCTPVGWRARERELP